VLVNLRASVWLSLVVSLGLVQAGADRACRADIFLLHNGGRVYGTWTNVRRQSADPYCIQAAEGVQLVLDASQVREAIVQEAAQTEYDRLAATCPHTVDGQWRLAEWCREQGLRKHRTACLRRILHLDPDHAAARHALGYSQVRGQWVTRQEIQQQRGYQLHDGRWRLPQDIALIEQSEEAERAGKQWLVQLRRWRELLATEDARQGYRSIEAVRDPHAAGPLAVLLAEEPFRHVKLLYIDVLAAIGSPTAMDALFHATLHDADIEIFHASLDQLVLLQPPHLARRYVEILKDDINVRVNRAAYALGRLDDKSVLSPLIDALTTTHYTRIPKQNDNYTLTFMNPAGVGVGPSASPSPLGGTSFSAGDQPQVIASQINNQEVLQSLIRLSGGVNFGFDQRAWRFWLANENQRSASEGLWQRARP
jgi:hypothetical protein